MKAAPCEICHGGGRIPEDGGRYLVKCLPCGGTGKKKYKLRKCPDCQGAGFNQGACVTCCGSGELPDESS